MENSFITPDNSSSENKEQNKGSFKSDINLPGKITKTIGRGEDAKNTFVYLTLRWAFWTGLVITLLVVINTWCFNQELKVPDIMGDISKTWEIVVPVITLALGYAFGKSKD